MGKMKSINKYLKVWLLMTVNVSQIAFVSRLGAILFIIGKFLRFSFFLLFLILLEAKTKSIGGYSFWQIIFFFATFNLIDTIPQFFLREVYRFRYYVVSGNFDYFLTKPISPLFRSLFGGSDILDVPMILISIIFIGLASRSLGVINPLGIALFLILVLNAFIIALAIHIIVISVGVLTTEVDNTIMLYRDLTQMGRIPVDIYREPVSWIITFAIPVGIMITFPAKVLMGLLAWQLIFISLFVSSAFLFGSLRFWKFALKNYTSVST